MQCSRREKIKVCPRAFFRFQLDVRKPPPKLYTTIYIFVIILLDKRFIYDCMSKYSYMNKKDVCEIEYVNKKAVKEVKSKMFLDKIFLKIADNFKILGDTTRIKIVYALSQKELCVCDLAALLGMTHSAVSHQLRVLRNLNLVKYRKEGKIVYYSLTDKHITKLIDMGVKHAKE